MTVLSLKYNFESVQDLYIRLTKIHFIFLHMYILLMLSKELYLNKAYLCKPESWDQDYSNKRNARYSNSSYKALEY